MRIWPQHSHKERVVYVPVALNDRRTTGERWTDPAYLDAVAGFAGNGVFMCEVSDALTECRAAADVAQTPDELKGVQVGIRLLKHVLTMAGRASEMRKAVQANREAAANDGSGLHLG